jgi:hypothetical protein
VDAGGEGRPGGGHCSQPSDDGAVEIDEDARGAPPLERCLGVRARWFDTPDRTQRSSICWGAEGVGREARDEALCVCVGRGNSDLGWGLDDGATP